jgi:hypothetical protein
LTLNILPDPFLILQDVMQQRELRVEDERRFEAAISFFDPRQVSGPEKPLGA